jgi:tetratricopeptide (TPR) repeat protein
MGLPAVLLSSLCFASFLPGPLDSPPTQANQQARREAAWQWWQMGQDAIDLDEPERAIACYRRSLHLDPTLVRNHLSLAAAHLERSQPEQAVASLKTYLKAKPEECTIRAYLGELLVQQGQLHQARRELDRAVADLQARADNHYHHLVDWHTRLMEIAQQLGDPYHEHLHRGIALYWLSRVRINLAGPEDELSTESLLGGALEELHHAQRLRPTRARPCWYLHGVWNCLGQQHPARRWFWATWHNRDAGDLTLTEERDCQLAWRRGNEEQRKK